MRKLILILSCIILINLVNATLTVSPNPMDVSVKVGETKDFTLELMNNFNFKIIDFEFGNLTSYGFSFPTVELNPNQSKQITFQVSPSKSYHQRLDMPVKFKYLVDLPEEITTYRINITEIGFNPNYLTIRNGDTITWTNIDDISHTVTSATFDHTLLPNQTFSYTFNSIGDINYNDLILFFSGIINVINRSTEQKAHNPNYDAIWTVNYDALLNPTALELVLLDTEFTLEATGQTEGAFRVKNTGTEIAEVIHFSSDSDWIIFSKNNINLNKAEQKYIDYTIKPRIFDSNETNKNYTITIKAKASNSEEYYGSINITIPYSDVFQDIGTEEGFLIWFAEVFCPSHPKNFLCNTTIAEGTNQTIIRDPEIQMNTSLISFYELKKDIQKMKDSDLRLENQIKIIADKWGITIPELMEIVNKSLSLQLTNEKKSNTRWDIIWILGGGIAIITSIIITITTFQRKQYKEYLKEGQYKYRR